jgi:hypothetical protein
MANRRNAQLSTGPKTAAGRLRSSQNARRHGLSVPVSADAELLQGVQRLALDITVEGNCSGSRHYADRIADAQVDLVRVRNVKRQMMLKIMHWANDADANSKQPDAAAPKRVVCPDAAMDMIEDFARLDRYERRAQSRRKAAIRAFDHARQETLTIEESKLAERSQKD